MQLRVQGLACRSSLPQISSSVGPPCCTCCRAFVKSIPEIIAVDTGFGLRCVHCLKGLRVLACIPSELSKRLFLLCMRIL